MNRLESKVPQVIRDFLNEQFPGRQSASFRHAVKTAVVAVLEWADTTLEVPTQTDWQQAGVENVARLLKEHMAETKAPPAPEPLRIRRVKHCPFCGGMVLELVSEPTVRLLASNETWTAWVRCQACLARGPRTFPDPRKRVEQHAPLSVLRTAVREWNRRRA